MKKIIFLPIFAFTLLVASAQQTDLQWKIENNNVVFYKQLQVQDISEKELYARVYNFLSSRNDDAFKDIRIQDATNGHLLYRGVFDHVYLQKSTLHQVKVDVPFLVHVDVKSERVLLNVTLLDFEYTNTMRNGPTRTYEKKSADVLVSEDTIAKKALTAVRTEVQQKISLLEQVLRDEKYTKDHQAIIVSDKL